MSYIGNEPIVSATRTVTEITATAGQTTFTANGGYTVGYIDVFVNGAQLQTSDFTATNGSTITLNSPAVIGDDIRLVAWGTFNTSSVQGNLAFSGTGNRITGDFSNATVANRVAFQTSTTNGATNLHVIPNGTSQSAGIKFDTDPNLTNSSVGSIDIVGGSSFGISSGLRGTGTYLPFTIATGGSERLRIDTSGNVGIGISSPASKLHVYDTAITVARINGNSANGADLLYVNDNNGNYGTIGAMGATAYSVGGWANSFVIESVSNSTGGLVLSSYNGATVFQTGSGRAERMRITSAGNVGIGTSTSGGWSGNQLLALQSGTSTWSCGAYNTSSSGGAFLGRIDSTAANLAQWYFGASTLVGSITTNGTATAYNTSSDYRLKENIAPMTGALAKVQQLKPCNWTWKVDGSDGQGFIAHELQEVVPQAVHGEKDAVDEEGNPKYQGVDTSFLVATLTAAIQELKTIVDNQKIELDNAKAEIELLKANTQQGGV